LAKVYEDDMLWMICSIDDLMAGWHHIFESLLLKGASLSLLIIQMHHITGCKHKQS